jgi:hypothetical protein
MSQVIWSGFNLPSAGTMLANASMLVNGALHGQWGSKLVPVGRVTNTTAFMGMGVTDAATWYNLSGGTQLNMSVTARTINSFYKDMGWNTNHIKVLSLSGVSGNYNAHGTLSRFSLAGQGPVTTSGQGSFSQTSVNGAYPLSIATLQGPQSPDIPALRMTHRVRLYERYGEFAPSPWWRQVFFGF